MDRQQITTVIAAATAAAVVAAGVTFLLLRPSKISSRQVDNEVGEHQTYAEPEHDKNRVRRKRIHRDSIDDNNSMSSYTVGTVNSSPSNPFSPPYGGPDMLPPNAVGNSAIGGNRIPMSTMPMYNTTSGMNGPMRTDTVAVGPDQVLPDGRVVRHLTQVVQPSAPMPAQAIAHTVVPPHYMSDMSAINAVSGGVMPPASIPGGPIPRSTMITAPMSGVSMSPSSIPPAPVPGVSMVTAPISGVPMSGGQAVGGIMPAAPMPGSMGTSNVGMGTIPPPPNRSHLYAGESTGIGMTSELKVVDSATGAVVGTMQAPSGTGIAPIPPGNVMASGMVADSNALFRQATGSSGISQLETGLQPPAGLSSVSPEQNASIYNVTESARINLMSQPNQPSIGQTTTVHVLPVPAPALPVQSSGLDQVTDTRQWPNSQPSLDVAGSNATQTPPQHRPSICTAPQRLEMNNSSLQPSAHISASSVDPYVQSSKNIQNYPPMSAQVLSGDNYVHVRGGTGVSNFSNSPASSEADKNASAQTTAGYDVPRGTGLMTTTASLASQSTLGGLSCSTQPIPHKNSSNMPNTNVGAARRYSETDLIDSTNAAQNIKSSDERRMRNLHDTAAVSRPTHGSSSPALAAVLEDSSRSEHIPENAVKFPRFSYDTFTSTASSDVIANTPISNDGKMRVSTHDSGVSSSSYHSGYGRDKMNSGTPPTPTSDLSKSRSDSAAVHSVHSRVSEPGRVEPPAGLSIKRPLSQRIDHVASDDALPSGKLFSGSRPHRQSSIVQRPFTDDYDLAEVIGRGTFSVVRKCVYRATGELRAVKCIDTKRFRLSQHWKQSRLLGEVQLLSQLGQHPNIVHLYDVYSEPSDHMVYIVTEFAMGGELFDSLVSAGNFSEDQARHVMNQALLAVQFMHSQDIIHRDLKPENILVMDSKEVLAAQGANPKLNVKLADFGVARYIGDTAGGAVTFCGSPQYVAPEILFARHGTSKYGKPVDIWSLGVVLYAMLAGYLPFDEYPDEDSAAAEAIDQQHLSNLTWEERVQQGVFHFPPPVWTHISNEAKSLIRSMLQVNPLKRLSVDECLNHEWFHGHKRINSFSAHAVVPCNPTVQTGAETNTVPRSTASLSGGGSYVSTTPPTPVTGTSLSPSSQEVSVQMLGMVNQALDLPTLLRLLHSTARHFEAAYNSVKEIPQAAEIIRMHAVKCRSLQAKVRQIIQRFQSSAHSVLAVLTDLQDAITDGDSPLAQALFAKLKEWVAQLKTDALNVQHEYHATIVDVQTSLQRASLFVSQQRNQQMSSASTQLQLTDTPLVSVKSTLTSDHSQPTVVTNDVRGSSSETHETGSSVISHTVNSTAGDAALSESSAQVTSSKHIDAIREAVEVVLRDPQHALHSRRLTEEEFVDLFLATPTIVQDTGRLVDLLEGLTSGSPIRAVRTPVSMNSTRVPTRASTAGSADSGSSETTPVSAVFDRAIATLSDSSHTVVHASSAGAGASSWVTSSATSTALARTSPSTLPSPSLGSPFGLSSVVPSTLSYDEQQDRLAMALNELRSVDDILTRCIEFWSSMELVIDVIVQRKEHSEVLLRHSTTPKMKARTAERLSTYRSFWRTFAFVCQHFTNCVDRGGGDLYAFLKEP